MTAQMFFNPAAGTYQTAAGFVCPFGERQWLWLVHDVVMPILLLSFSSFRTAVFT
jgi:hypothetical protein